MISVSPEIITVGGTRPGPTLAIFAGVHGNETAGVLALQELLPRLKVTRGTLLIAFANPPALEANVRMINKNLNRCFFPDNNGNAPEDIRARELMAVLDTADALLDLHMFYDDDGLPFVICEDDAVPLARKFDVDIISTNWDEVEPGATDWYMFKQGKPGVCVECGPISKAAEYKDFAIRTIYQFLRYYDMTEEKVAFSVKPKRIIKANYPVYKSSENFILTPGLHNFDRLQEEQVIARDGDKEFKGSEGQCIIFPHYKARIDEEAYIIGTELK